MKPSRRRSCTGKVKYATKAMAEEAIRVIVDKRHRHRFSAYECRWCRKFWHFGHTPWWQRKERI